MNGCAMGTHGKRPDQSTCCLSTFMAIVRLTVMERQDGSTLRSEMEIITLNCIKDCRGE